MVNRISDEELEFVECLYNPLCLTECLFSDLSNLSFFDEGRLGHVRLGQIPLLSYEYIIDENPRLNDKENFENKMGAGSLYVLGGRNFGKTLSEEIDIILSLMLNDGYPMGLTSYDAIHIRGVLEPVISVLNTHPVVSQFKRNIKRSPSYLITSKNNSTVEGINMNIAHKDSGSNFFQKHFKKIWVEEASFETDEVYKKRIDSRHETGCIERGSGMTNFTKHSPAGRIFYDQEKKSQVLNLPQYINPFWDDKEKAKAIKKYGGENSIGYRIFVKGEVVEEGVSVFDMERIRPYYLTDKKLKTFEINKKTLPNLESILILEKPSNAEILYLCADIGESAPTEIVVIIKINKKYRLTHTITLYGLTDKEQFKVIRYIADMLQANYIGIDCTDGTGRAIFRSLEEIYSRKNLVWVAFNEKIGIDFDRDENGNLKRDGQGKPVLKEEYVSEWSIRHLKEILYDGMTEIPEDAYKFDTQINSVISAQSINRTIYECISEEDHLFQAFQVWSIAHWLNEWNITKPVNSKIFSKFGA